MALKITKISEPLKLNNVIALIYGDPSVGKTSLMATCKNPFILDFDNGMIRALSRTDSAQITSWKEIEEIDPSDFTNYDTIIIDTMSRATDFCEAHIVNQTGKKTFGIRDWGTLNTKLISFLKDMTMLGKDVVLVCHGKSITENEQNYVTPSIRDKVMDSLYGEITLLGYIRQAQGKYILSFDKVEDGITKTLRNKNTGNHPSYNTRDDGFSFAQVIQRTKDVQNKLSIEIAAKESKTLELINNFKLKIQEAKTTEELDAVFEEVEKSNFSKAYKLQIYKDLEATKVAMSIAEFKSRLEEATTPEEFHKIFEDIKSKTFTEEQKKQISGDLHCLLDSKNLLLDPEGKVITKPLVKEMPPQTEEIIAEEAAVSAEPLVEQTEETPTNNAILK